MKLKVVIVDDEKASINTLKRNIDRNFPNLEIIGTYQSPSKAMLGIRRNPPDILFLDIQMPGMTGFELLEAYGEINFDVIFVTAFNNYAIQAFNVNAIHYLLKPISVNDLKEAIERIKKHQVKAEAGIMQNLIDQMKKDKADFKKIAIPLYKKIILVDRQEILYLKANGDSTYVYLSSGVNSKEELHSLKSMKEWEKTFANMGEFKRIHHGYIANLNKAKEFNYSTKKLLLEVGEELKVSDTKFSILKAFFERLGNHK